MPVEPPRKKPSPAVVEDLLSTAFTGDEEPDAAHDELTHRSALLELNTGPNTTGEPVYVDDMYTTFSVLSGSPRSR